MASTVDQNQKVSFILNLRNASVIAGTVSGKFNYTLAKQIGGDLLATHAAVKMNIPNLDNIEYLNFFSLVTEAGVTQVYAEEWITEGSLKVIATTDHIDIRVHGVAAADIPDLRAVLQASGYNISILT